MTPPESVPTPQQLLKRYLDNHCVNADAEGMSTFCECKLCRDTRAILAGASVPTPAKETKMEAGAAPYDLSSGRLVLCTCTMVSGGQRALNTSCPIHAGASVPTPQQAKMHEDDSARRVNREIHDPLQSAAATDAGNQDDCAATKEEAAYEINGPVSVVSPLQSSNDAHRRDGGSSGHSEMPSVLVRPSDLIWKVAASFVLGGWQRTVDRNTELFEAIRAGTEISPIAEVCVRLQRRDADWPIQAQEKK